MAAEGILANGVTEILKRLITLMVGLATGVKEKVQMALATGVEELEKLQIGLATTGVQEPEKLQIGLATTVVEELKKLQIEIGLATDVEELEKLQTRWATDVEELEKLHSTLNVILSVMKEEVQIGLATTGVQEPEKLQIGLATTVVEEKLQIGLGTDLGWVPATYVRKLEKLQIVLGMDVEELEKLQTRWVPWATNVQEPKRLQIRLATKGVEELGKLHSTLNVILSVMTDAERKQWNDASVKYWMKDIKSLAYEADDIMDEISYKLKHLRSSKVSTFFSFRFIFPEIVDILKSINEKFSDINKKFSDISRRRDKLGLVYCIDSSSDTMISDVHERNMKRKTYSYVDASKKIGRENDESEIIEMLGMDGGEAVSVIPIVGMGGLGKTTLAQLVYKDVSNFDVKMWVCVTPTFNLKRIFQNITESITNTTCEDVSDLDVLVRQLQQHLKGKRFLLVVDDVWKVNQEEWDKLKKPLTVGAVGSKIIITTRSLEVASTVIGVGNKSFPAYQLQPLQFSYCWSIFTQRAFGVSRGEANPPNLVAIGKDLLNRCDGLPLAVHFLGNLLRNKEEREWLIIKESEIWDKHVEEGENRILPVLKLSYDLLPSQLKQCFSYCSIFPKNAEINRETLIQLWIAEGFLCETDEMTLTEIGSMYFKYLLNNSFFQDVHDYGETLTCKMHDLVHDLAQSVTGKEECLILAESSAYNMQYISNTRRLRLVNLDEEMLPIASDMLSYALRSLFVNVQIHRSMNIRSVIDNNKLLRVLDLSGSDLEDLPPSIGKLIHLRYLDLSNTNITMLPESFSNLYNLRTLKLIATKIPRVPKGMEKLSNLKHFKFTLRMLELPREDVYTDL